MLSLRGQSAASRAVVLPTLGQDAGRQQRGHVSETRSNLRRSKHSESGQRYLRATSFLALASVFVACGDGVGRPLVAAEDEPTAGTGGVEGTHCEQVASWPAESETAEDDVLEAVNVLRALGLSCNAERLEPLPALVMHSRLRCAARLHSEDMARRDFFDHVNPDGVNYPERIEFTGYHAVFYGESIARGDAGYGTQAPWAALEEIFGRGDADCENLVDPRFDAVGIGHYEGVWTLDFGGN